MKQTKKKTLHRQLPTTGTNTVDVNRPISINKLGGYSIKVISMSTDGANRAGNTSDIVMSYNYLNDSNMNAFIGDNGFVLRGNKDNYFHLSFLNSVMTLKAKGNVDMPGFLASYKVLSSGSIAVNDRFGAKVVSTPALPQGQGKYRVYHAIKHSNYQVQITPVLGTTACFGMVVTKGTTYVDIAIYKYDGSLYSNAFEITLIGDNI